MLHACNSKRIWGILAFVAVFGAGLPTARAAGDKYEPDDTYNKAKAIGNGQTQTRSIHQAGNVDWVKFTLTRCSAVTIDTNGTGVDTEMWLFGPNSGSTPAATPSYSDDAHDLCAKIEHKAARALAPGVYYVKVQDYGNNGTIASYTIKVTMTPATSPVTTPTFNPASPYIFASSTTVTVSCATKGATIRYTTNGSTPKSTSTVYKNPLTFSATTTLKAAAFKPGMGNSDVATGYYCRNTDPYEPDDSGSAAKTIISGETQRHNGSPAQANDWLTFTVKEISTVTINLDESSKYKVDLFLYDDPAGYWSDQITYSYSGTISLSLNPGTYYLRCYPWYTAVQSYYVSLAIAP